MFDLHIRLTIQHVPSLKEHLRSILPTVKHQHGLEAVARGLGFANYKALLTHSEKESTEQLSTLGYKGFEEYLRDREIIIPVEKFFHVVAAVAISDVMDRIPALTSHGFGVGQIKRTPNLREEYARKYKEGRDELLSEYSIQQFLRSLALIRELIPIKTISKKSNSYRLKHLAENMRCTYPTGKRLGPAYVANGAFIAAAVHSGFKFRNRYDSLNATFNLSEKRIEDLDCVLRPDGAAAQSREWRNRNRLDGKNISLHKALKQKGADIPFDPPKIATPLSQPTNFE